MGGKAVDGDILFVDLVWSPSSIASKSKEPLFVFDRLPPAEF